jgi:RNA recognition motif-containing protein
LEKNKLFVKDLSKDTSREHLEEIFGKFGPLKEVRLITFRNGHSKGLAFVEFSDEVSAAKALIKTDGNSNCLIICYLLRYSTNLFNHFTSFMKYNNLILFQEWKSTERPFLWPSAIHLPKRLCLAVLMFAPWEEEPKRSEHAVGVAPR